MFFLTALTLSLLVFLSCASTANASKSALQRLREYLQVETETGISVDFTKDRQVDIGMIPLSISSLNAADQTFTFSAAITMSWFDKGLTWKPAEFDNIENVTISSNKVWVPSLVIPNGIDNIVPPSVLAPIIHSNGRASLIFLENFKTSCQIDITLYPFDEQQCSILFLPVRDYKLGVSTTSFMERLPAFFIENNEWELDDILSKVEHFEMTGVSNIAKFEFVLKRKSMFYVVSIIFPMTLLSLLNACVFLLPADSGEKMSYLISIFVSYAVFMNFVNDSIPKSGEVCRLSVYLTLVLCQSCLTIITTMASLNIRHNGLLFRPTTSVQPVQPANSPVRTSVKSALNARQAERVLFGVFLLLALMSLLVFCV